jgi:hypothetical protein
MSVDNPWTVVFHEYAHQLMSGNLSAEVDPWFEEGFAEYFSSIETDGKQARVGKIPSDTYEILRQNGFIKISDLFRVQHNSRLTTRAAITGPSFMLNQRYSSTIFTTRD